MTNKNKTLKTTKVSYEDYTSLDFQPPANYCIRVADGDYVYIHCRERAAAEQYVKDEYNGKYTVRVG